MIEQGTIEPENVEINKVYEIRINDNKIKIEINNDEIIFNLMIGISNYKYIKNYKYEELIKELNIVEYKNKEDVYNYLIKSKYKIIEEGNIKKIIINNKQIKLNEKLLKSEEIINLLMDEMKEIKNNNIKQNERINELIKNNEEKENKINKLIKKFIELKKMIKDLEEEKKDLYKDEINLIYETEKEGIYNIFGEKFVEINNKNI